MAFLASITSLIGEINVTPFTDFPWALILNSGMSAIGFYALRIILLTVCLKILLFPLDLFQRYKMRKNQLITMRLKPQLEKLEKAYGSNPKVLQQKQAELNKREGMSYLASCLPMIVTMVVFIWLWSALQTTANYKQFDNYINVYSVYRSAYEQSLTPDYYDESTGGLKDSYGEAFRVAYDEAFETYYLEDKNIAEASKNALEAGLAVSAEGERSTAFYTLYAETYSNWFEIGFEDSLGVYGKDEMDKALKLAAETGTNNAASVSRQYCETVAQNDVYDFYFSQGEFAEEGKGYQRDSFLWIKDIWSADTPWANSLAPTQGEFKTAIGVYGNDASRSGLEEAELERILNSYDTVMARVIDEGDYGVNGWLILPILAVGLNVLMQIITRKQQKRSGQDMASGQNAGCMKAMVFVMPVIMGFFALMYCAAFTLYMVTNSAMSLLINLVSTQISKKMIPINASSIGGGKGQNADIERYGRPDPNNSKGNRK